MLTWFLAIVLAQGAQLSEAHRAWLEEEVHFIISTRERQSFLALESEEARRRFIEEFWRRRDPTPGTARNEARESHLALLAEADRLFTEIGSRRGRFTDRGRLFQILGPPQSREDYTRLQNRLYPLEMWQYTGITDPFLPEAFYLIFFREGGFGEYRLWSPAADGPQALVKEYEPGRFLLDPKYAFEQLKSLDFELALAVERLVPGEGEESSAQVSESLLTDLREYADMAERHIRLREEVTARASFQILQLTPFAISLIDSTGIPQVHYALEIPSSNARWAEEQGRYRTSFSLTCKMLDVEGKEIDRIDDTLDLDLGAEEKNALDEVPLSFQGRLTLPPERYRLEFLLANTTGGGTETASIPVEVGGMEGAGASEILLARSRARISRGEFLDNRPFQIEELIVSPSPDHVFPPVQTVAYLQIWRIPEAGTLAWSLSRGDETVWESSAPLPPSHGPTVTVEQVVPLESLPDGVYTLSARFPGGNRRTELTVDGSATIPSVRVLSREALPAGHGRIRFQRGVLYSRRGETEKAIEEMAEAARLLPRDLEVHLNLAYLLTATAQHQRVLDVLKPIEPHHPNEVDLLVFMAFASLKLGHYEDAVSYYERALAQRPRDERIEKALEEARRARKAGPKSI